MAATNSTDRRELSMANKYRDRETSPDRTKMTILPKSKSELKVAVVYYLTRNGQFEHPHFMEVPLSSPQGLQLKDVTDRLNHLRGQGMARMYSWSSKRRYKNGFVWQDLSETDSIHPCGGHEYILKGSLLLETSQSFRYDTTSSRTSKVFSDIVSSSSEDSNPPAIRRKNRSWTTFDDLEEYKVYKAKITGEIASEGTHNVSTQTDDNRRVKIDGTREIGHRGPSTMLGSKEEASKPSLKSSSKAVESLEVRSVEENGPAATIKNEKAGNDCPSGRMKPSVVLMKLVGCGSKRFSNKN
ncbi:protein UPSTREAM OF FLC-like [Populus alba x Populus x berolinensis]|nr:protein UPSTREAM OF FLC-like [Populus alba x Populus x berolinensis]